MKPSDWSPAPLDGHAISHHRGRCARCRRITLARCWVTHPHVLYVQGCWLACIPLMRIISAHALLRLSFFAADRQVPSSPSCELHQKQYLFGVIHSVSTARLSGHRFPSVGRHSQAFLFSTSQCIIAPGLGRFALHPHSLGA